MLPFPFQYSKMHQDPLPLGHLPKGEKVSLQLSHLGGAGGGLVENTGVEPVASCVQGRRSSQLS